MAGELTVIAEFTVSEENKAKFLEVCAYDSKHSPQDEEGCLSFDVMTLNDDRTTIALVETYVDQAAFDAHLKTPHFSLFSNALKELSVQEKSVRFYTRTAP